MPLIKRIGLVLDFTAAGKKVGPLEKKVSFFASGSYSEPLDPHPLVTGLSQEDSGNIG